MVERTKKNGWLHCVSSWCVVSAASPEKRAIQQMLLETA
jgi:hypothetical protein